MLFRKLLVLASLAAFSAGWAQQYQFTDLARLTDSGNTGFNNGHTVVIQGNKVYVVWMGSQETGGLYNHIYLSRSSDGGSTFQPSVRVDSGPVLYSWTYYPSLALDSSGALYCAWEESSATLKHAYCAKSTDGGQSFMQRTRIDGPEGIFPQNPVLACDRNGSVYVTWADFRDTTLIPYAVFFAKSTDGGLSFSAAMRLSPDFPSLRAGFSTLALDLRGNIHVVWRDDRDDVVRDFFHVYYTRSTDGGNSFLPDVQIDSTGPTHGTFPSFAVDSSGTNIWVAYKDRSTGETQVYLSRSTDGGASFFDHHRVDSLQLGPSDVPSIALTAPQRLFFTWMQVESTSYPQVYFRCSFDGGLTLSPICKVNTSSSSYGGNPLLTSDSLSIVYISWWERQSALYVVYHARGTPSNFMLEGSQSVAAATELSVAPNPLTDRTSISYSLPRAGNVSLKLYGVTGRLVATLSRDYTLAGSHTAHFDTSKLARGIYLLKYEHEGNTTTSKLIIE